MLTLEDIATYASPSNASYTVSSPGREAFISKTDNLGSVAWNMDMWLSSR
jgi:hypothetical protein